MIIFNGTSRLGEILAVIDNWGIKHRLIRLDFLTKSMTGEETARKLINLIVTFTRDGASVNNIAMGVGKVVVYPNIFDLM